MEAISHYAAIQALSGTSNEFWALLAGVENGRIQFFNQKPSITIDNTTGTYFILIYEQLP